MKKAAFKKATEKAMEGHIAALHGESNSGYYVPKKTEDDKKKENELKIAIAQCRRSSDFQVTSINLTNDVQQDINFIHNGATGSENNNENEQIPNNSKARLRQVSVCSIPTVDTPIESGLVSIGVKHKCFDSAIPFTVNDNEY